MPPVIGGASPESRTSKEGGDIRQTFTQTQTSTLPAATKAERLDAAGVRKLGGQQQALLEEAIQRTMGGASPFSMTAEEAAAFGAPYEAALARMRLEGKEFADVLAGGRGLRTSDTPIAQQAIQRFGLGLAELEAQRAQNQLQFGLMGNQFKVNSALGLSSALPAGRQFSLARALQQRMAQPTTTASGINTGRYRGFNEPSPLSGVEQGLGIDSKVLDNIGKGMSLWGGGMAMSDRRLKREITPVKWKWKTSEKEYFGVIAQGLQQSHPHLVKANDRGELMVDYGTMVAMLLDEREALYHQLEAGTA